MSEVARSTLELTRTRFRAGLVGDLDVAQAEASLASVESIVPTLDSSAQAAMHRIGVLLGRMPTDVLPELSKVSAIPAVPAESAVGMPSELLRRRPDIRRAERQLGVHSWLRSMPDWVPRTAVTSLLAAAGVLLFVAGAGGWHSGLDRVRDWSNDLWFAVRYSTEALMSAWGAASSAACSLRAVSRRSSSAPGW